ncbi:protein kinase domain-containing protein [Cystobacter fuscus]
MTSKVISTTRWTCWNRSWSAPRARCDWERKSPHAWLARRSPWPWCAPSPSRSPGAPAWDATGAGAPGRGRHGRGVRGVRSAAQPARGAQVAPARRRGTEPRPARLRLMREAQSMARLSHPHVLPVYDIGEHGDRVFIALEHVEGSTLRQWLQEAGRPWREVLGVLAQAGEGLAAAHAAGLVHRDFKPDNVLVGRDGRVLVYDFGLACEQGTGSPAPPCRWTSARSWAPSPPCPTRTPSPV